MIASILLVALGFLSACILALLAMPTVWRRAVRLTTRRIQATVPLTANELRAEKDKVRAQYAMTTRRLEMQAEDLQARHALQLVRIGNHQKRESALAGEIKQREEEVFALRRDAESVAETLRLREGEALRLTERLGEAEEHLRSRDTEVKTLGQTISALRLDAVNQQAEIVARQARLEKSAADIDMLREEIRDANRREREAETKRLAAEETLKVEKRRTAEMNDKIEKLMALLADREEALETQSGRIDELRARMEEDAGKAAALAEALEEAGTRRHALEAELSEISHQLESLLSGTKAEQIEKAMEKLDAERRSLEEKLNALTKENDELRAASQARSTAAPERREDAMLREQISNLAAEVVHLTAMVEGPGSAIQKALDMPAPAAVSGAVASLGERVKALQKASAPIS